MPTLHVRSGNASTRSVPVTRTVLIGRGRGADLQLLDPGISTRHAMVRATESGVFVMDLGSQNGTFVNQRRVDTPVRLTPGDVLRLGDAVVEFRGDAPAEVPGSTAIRLRQSDPGETQVRLSVRVEAPRFDRRQDDGPVRAARARQAALLDGIGKLLVQSLDPATLLPLVADRLLEFLPQAERVFVLRGHGRTGELHTQVSRARAGTTNLVLSQALIQRVVDKGEGLLYSEVHVDGPVAASESLRATVRCAMCSPMVFDQHLYGVIQVDTTSGATAFSEPDLHSLMAVATQVAGALAYGRLHQQQLAQGLLDHDLDLARRIQRQFLPDHPPTLDEFAFAVEYSPAQAVGGDFYDFIPLDRGRLAVVVGDVSGKGIAAAIYAASVLAEVRGLVTIGDEPVRALHELNRRLASRDREGMFVTMALATLVAGTGELTVATAGHPLPLLRSRTGTVAPIGRIGSPPLGIDEHARFESHRYRLEPGDAVIAYTDGISEATGPGDELFGSDRLSQAVAASNGTAAGLRDAVVSAARVFLRDRAFGDDVTVVCFARRY